MNVAVRVLALAGWLMWHAMPAVAQEACKADPGMGTKNADRSNLWLRTGGGLRFSRRNGDNRQTVPPPSSAWLWLCEHYGEAYRLTPPEQDRQKTG